MRDKTGVLELCSGEPEQPKKKIECCKDYFTRLEPEYIELSKFIPPILFSAKGITDEIAMFYVRRAAIEFASQTQVLYRFYDFELQDCVNDYYLCTPNERIVRIDKVCLNGNCLEKGKDECEWFGYRFNQPDQIIIRSYEKCGNVMIEGFVAPSETACIVDRILFDNHRSAIEKLALAEIYTIPNREWSNPQLGGYMKAQVQNTIARAIQDNYNRFGVENIMPQYTY